VVNILSNKIVVTDMARYQDSLRPFNRRKDMSFPSDESNSRGCAFNTGNPVLPAPVIMGEISHCSLLKPLALSPGYRGKGLSLR